MFQKGLIIVYLKFIDQKVVCSRLVLKKTNHLILVDNERVLGKRSIELHFIVARCWH